MNFLEYSSISPSTRCSSRRGAQRDGDQGLRFAPLEHGRAVRPRQHIDVAVDVAQRLAVAAVGPRAGQDQVADDALLPDRARLARTGRRSIAPSASGSGIISAMRPFLQRAAPLRPEPACPRSAWPCGTRRSTALAAGRTAVVVRRASNAVFCDAAPCSNSSRCSADHLADHAVGVTGSPRPSRLRAFRGQSPRSSPPLLPSRRRSSPDRCPPTRRAWGRHELAVDPAHPHRGDRAVKRQGQISRPPTRRSSPARRRRSAGRWRAQCLELHFVVETLGKQGPNRAVHQPRRQRLLDRRTAFPLDEAAGKLAGRRRPLAIVARQGEEIDARLAVGRW